ncbi:MAG: hypothetical protein COB93_03555 [Sneathiella sp.]|nr:MAG: hypothetical protein COB93_03555 [Sneathiella sp.]
MTGSMKKYGLQLVVLISVMAGLCLPVAEAAETTLQVRATDQGSVGQLVLDWGHVQPFSAELEDGFLYVRFTTPFDADFTEASNILSSYVGPGEILEGQQSFRFPLKGDIQLSAKNNGTEIVLDLTKSKVATGKSRVKIRSGEHDAYTRLVFDWPGKSAKYSAEVSGSELIVTFDAIADIDAGKINEDPPALIKSLTAQIFGTTTRVVISLSSDMVMSSFTNENSVVFDVRTKTNSAAAEQKPAPQIEVAAAPIAAPVPAVLPEPVVPEGQETDEIVQTAPALKTDMTFAVVVTNVLEIEPENYDNLKPDELDEISPASGSVITSIGPTVIVDAPPVIVDAPPAIVEAPPVPRQEKQVEKMPAKSVLNRKSVAAQNSEKMAVKIANLKDGFRLIFPWQTPAAMAMFEHGGAYWVVFDEGVSADFSGLAGPYKFLVTESSQLAHETATILRFKFRDGYMPKVSKANDDWHIDFQLDAKKVVENAIEVQSQAPTLSGPRLFVPAVQNGEKVNFTDAETEHELTVVPLHVAGWAFVESKTYEMITILPTVQGIALFAEHGDMDVAVEQNGVVVSARAEPGKMGKLLAEKPEPTLTLDPTPTPNFHKAHFVKLADWRQVKPLYFTIRKQELQNHAALAGPEDKLKSLMSLAKYYVAHGFHADATGVLAEIKKRYQKIGKDREFRLLVGLSSFGLHHLDIAKHNLFHADFDGDVEVAPWRGILSAELGNWEQAAQDLNYGAGAFNIYETSIQNRFNLVRARAALEDFDVSLAEKILALVKEPKSNEQASARALLQGMAALQLSDLPLARLKFDEALELGYRPIAERARFTKINGDLEAKEISPEDAIRELEKLDFAWRGDALEVDIQKRLGDLYVATGKIGNGLETYKRIVRNFPKSPYSRGLGRKMNDMFAELFLEGGADELPPIKALAIYYQYRELTPVGRKGDKMIRILADRLARIDLLEQSAQLLEHQINFRLKGEERADAGTKLAVIHLWNDKPKDSLRVLYETRWRQLPPSAKKERKYIEARAQAGLQNYSDALDLLAQDNSDDANILRADIHWKSKNWAKAIPALERLIGNSGSDTSEDLDRMDRQRIMQLAVARSLAKDKSGIRKMRATFRPKLEGTGDLAAFDLITEENDPSASEFRERATIIAKVSQLESFMAGYREKLNNGEFWATY